MTRLPSIPHGVEEQTAEDRTADATICVPQITSMEILGCLLHKDGFSKVSYQHRAAKAEKAFWADEEVLTCKDIPLKVRFKRYIGRIVPRFTHDCGSWTWCQSLHQYIMDWEGKSLRSIVASERQ